MKHKILMMAAAAGLAASLMCSTSFAEEPDNSEWLEEVENLELRVTQLHMDMMELIRQVGDEDLIKLAGAEEDEEMDMQGAIADVEEFFESAEGEQEAVTEGAEDEQEALTEGAKEAPAEEATEAQPDDFAYTDPAQNIDARLTNIEDSMDKIDDIAEKFYAYIDNYTPEEATEEETAQEDEEDLTESAEETAQEAEDVDEETPINERIEELDTRVSMAEIVVGFLQEIYEEEEMLALAEVAIG